MYILKSHYMPPREDPYLHLRTNSQFHHFFFPFRYSYTLKNINWVGKKSDQNVRGVAAA